MENYAAIAGGNSSLTVSRNAKGDYVWEMKLYFLGNDMRTIRQMLIKIGKSRRILEDLLGQKIVPTESMSAYLRSLRAEIDRAIVKSMEEVEAKGNDEKQGNANG